MTHADHIDETPDANARAEPDDLTLAGYFAEHARPPAFGGPDGESYTVSLEIELTPTLEGRYEGYLVFPRWAASGIGVLGHVETGTLATGESSEAVLESLGRLPLTEVKALLDRTVRKKMEHG